MRPLEVGDHVHLHLDDRAEPHDALVHAFVRSMEPTIQVVYVVAEPLGHKVIEVPFWDHRNMSIPPVPRVTDPKGIHRE